MHLVGAGLNQTIKEGAILEIVKAIRFVDEVIPYKAVDEIEKQINEMQVIMVTGNEYIFENIDEALKYVLDLEKKALGKQPILTYCEKS